MPAAMACFPRASTYHSSSLVGARSSQILSRRRRRKRRGVFYLQSFSVFLVTLSLSTSRPDSGIPAFCTVGISMVEGRVTMPWGEVDEQVMEVEEMEEVDVVEEVEW